jgi:septin family protein
VKVTVIPVIAKADTMTEDELAEYRQEVRGWLRG